MRELVQGIAAANGAEAEFTFERGYPSVVNDPAAVERAARAGAKLLGADKIIHERLPGMGGEDFAYMAQKVPGCFVRIGQADGEKGSKPVHTVHTTSTTTSCRSAPRSGRRWWNRNCPAMVESGTQPSMDAVGAAVARATLPPP